MDQCHSKGSYDPKIVWQEDTSFVNITFVIKKEENERERKKNGERIYQICKRTKVMLS